LELACCFHTTSFEHFLHSTLVIPFLDIDTNKEEEGPPLDSLASLKSIYAKYAVLADRSPTGWECKKKLDYMMNTKNSSNETDDINKEDNVEMDAAFRTPENHISELKARHWITQPDAKYRAVRTFTTSTPPKWKTPDIPKEVIVPWVVTASRSKAETNCAAAAVAEDPTGEKGGDGGDNENNINKNIVHNDNHNNDDNNNGDAGGYGGINTTADNGDNNEDGTVVVNEDRDGPEFCNVCHDDPCVWLQHFEKISEYDRVLHLELSDKEKPSPNECRSHLYSQMAHHLWGALGRGNRKSLPDCVVTEIRNLHPSPNGNYMGHMEE
jgi:hypothetical protein